MYQNTRIYDILHTPGTAREADGLLRMARRFLKREPRSFLEPACGTGRYLRVLARRGYRCAGFDLSADMVRFAKDASRAISPPTRFFVADMTSFDAGRSRFDAAFNLVNTIRHLPTDADMLAHFARIADAIRPEGYYAVGISLSVYGREAPSEDIWNARRGARRVTQVISYFPPEGRGAGTHNRAERVHSHICARSPRHEEHVSSTYDLRCYSIDQWRSLVDRSALRIRAVVDEFGRDLDFSPPGYAVWILTPR